MFVTATQFYVFIACVAYGVISGIILSLSNIIKFKFRSILLWIIADVFAIVLISTGYVYYSFRLSFPNFRAYMFFGVILGWLLFYKSFYLILAKSVKNIYNIYVRKKGKKQDERKRI